LDQQHLREMLHAQLVPRLRSAGFVDHLIERGAQCSLGDVLKEGAVFRWSTFGLPLESKINEFVPYARIGWYGYAHVRCAGIGRPASTRAKFWPASSRPHCV
jgi:hypothetical protein